MPDESSVRVIERACQVLDCFTKQQPQLQIGDIRERTGLPATTVARIVKTLVSQKLLERNGNEYRLGLRVLVWNAPATAASALITVAGPVLEQLCDATHESTGCSIRQGVTRVTVAVALSSESIIYNGYVGQVMPLHAGAAGKVFMAFDPTAYQAAIAAGLTAYTESTTTTVAAIDEQLDQIRSSGWAYTVEEREPGLNSIAAPLRDGTGEVVAAISVGGPSFRLTPAAAQSYGPLVASAAQSISQRLGYAPHLRVGIEGAPLSR